MWAEYLLLLLWAFLPRVAAADSSSSDLQVLQRLSSLLSENAVTATCPRKLSLGANCECNFRDEEGIKNKDIVFDKHVYGRRKVCIGTGFLWFDSCRVLSVQEGRFSAGPASLQDPLQRFGCGAATNIFFSEEEETGKFKDSFPLRAQMRKYQLKTLDLLDVSAPGSEPAILADLLARRVKVRQLSLTLVLDGGVTLGDDSNFSLEVARARLNVLEDLLAAGYSMLSYVPHPKCVESVEKEHGICLPLFADTTWVKGGGFESIRKTA